MPIHGQTPLLLATVRSARRNCEAQCFDFQTGSKDRLLEPFLGLADSTSTLYLDLSFDRLLESRPCDSDQNDMIERAMKMLLDARFGFGLFVRLECTKLTGYGVYYCDQVKKLYLPFAAAAPLPVGVITQAMRHVYRRVEALVEEVPTKQVPSRSSLKRGRAAEFHNLSEKIDKGSMLDDAIEYLMQAASAPSAGMLISFKKVDEQFVTVLQKIDIQDTIVNGNFII
ncbi:hypothetical protein RHGRI_003957 [Rhododendron griersonianum]|uniref:Uncharacterized protein n=1 Tax=Rhododendron griersonianum TaxID=479676 RepID=A0AAV6L785_9ERIC|nr:hypothetical protein RHGRI_003957 [Rhododendron griersonianum]